MADTDKPVREIRLNPIVPSESVLVATARSMRPKKDEAPAPRDTRAHVETCPFCTGNESMTPPAIAAYPAASSRQIASGRPCRCDMASAIRSLVRRAAQRRPVSDRSMPRKATRSARDCKNMRPH